MKQHFTHPLARDLAIICGLGGMLIALFWGLGWDTAIAKAVYAPNSAWAWELRQLSQWPLLVLSVAALVFLLIWPLRLRWPHGRQLAAVWLATLIFGAGLINQVIVQEIVERPRPRESVLVADESAVKLGGKSFPSGHAVIGFMAAVPFFIYRRRRPCVAYAALAAGTVAGLGIGYGRMVLGAHFVSDIIAAGAIVYASAAVFAWLIKPTTDVPNKITVPILLTGIWAMVWFNSFTLSLTHTVQNEAGAAISLPCATFSYHGAPQGTSLTVQVSGYGAPLSNLLLKERDGTVTLQRWMGLYRDLSCQITLQTP